MPSASPSTRREWIEIAKQHRFSHLLRSPSTRREWIEIQFIHDVPPLPAVSPSTRREWIEISSPTRNHERTASPSTRREWIEIGEMQGSHDRSRSPSTRREWIEIAPQSRHVGAGRLPPHGGSGLKSRCGLCLMHFAAVSLHTEGVD